MLFLSLPITFIGLNPGTAGYKPSVPTTKPRLLPFTLCKCTDTPLKETGEGNPGRGRKGDIKRGTAGLFRAESKGGVA